MAESPHGTADEERSERPREADPGESAEYLLPERCARKAIVARGHVDLCDDRWN